MKNPHCNDVYIPQDGYELVSAIFESNVFSFSATEIAKAIVRGKTKKEITLYIRDILMWIETAKIESLRRQCPRMQCPTARHVT